MAKQGKAIDRRAFMRGSAAAGLGAGAAALGGLAAQDVGSEALQWHREADVVVVGSGAAGMPAAIRARDLGATVLVIEENYDIGGHGIISQGSVALGGGTSIQKQYGIEDSADQVYLENTRPDHTHTRYADRKVVRAFADHNVEAFEFLVANGVQFTDVRPHRVPAEGARDLPAPDDDTVVAGSEGDDQQHRRLRPDARAGAERAREGRGDHPEASDDPHHPGRADDGGGCSASPSRTWTTTARSTFAHGRP